MPKFTQAPFNPTALGVTEENSWLDEEHEEAISDGVSYLVESLSAIHGDVRLAKEKSGLHAYMASPDCLATDGTIELSKKHLAVNLDKAMAENPNCALCMKTQQRYTVSGLLRMRPLEQRMDNYRGRRKIYWGATVAPSDLEQDENGNTIPKSPGICTPVGDLPQDHPAQHWLARRQAAIPDLDEMFHTVFCHQSQQHVSLTSQGPPINGGVRSFHHALLASTVGQKSLNAPKRGQLRINC